ncbi:MAG: PEP/pyruvate-binding domain-containing protein [Acidobacteria bacterium]|nr:PEP/pyruvate-binding domain-containing protein [Acidobacteriota bacterium]
MARITYGSRVYETPGFTLTPWVQRSNFFVKGALAGSIEVAYRENPSEPAEPFLLEETKLINTIARWLGRCVETRQAEAAVGTAESRGARAAAAKPEWEVILDLLEETDAALWRRIVRRLMNHLSQLGVPGVQRLITYFGPATYADRDRDSRGANQPLPKGDAASVTRLFDEIIRLASVALPAADLTVLLKQWTRQDRLGFLAMATEQRDRSLVEFAELVNRFCRSAREGEAALAPADDLNVRVTMTRRFLTDRLSFIGAAKQYLSIHDFGRLLNRVIGPPQGDGQLGGKAAGLFLAEHVLRKKGKGNRLIETVRVPHAWCMTSDGLFEFMRYNSLEDFQSFKYSTSEEVSQSFPYLEQVFKHSFFPPDMLNDLKVALDDLGDWPVIVRSSSLLEDSEGSAFSGKYRSLFLPNSGSKEERLAALVDAIAEVYASVFGPDPIQYRKERGLLDFMEEMGILIQRVVGTRVGKYFFPAFAGVAFSNNEFRWSPRIRREDGVIRVVTGLGTRAVDRVGDDYPMLLCPGQPGLRVNVSPEEIVHYSQRYVDVLNLDTGRFESPHVKTLLHELGQRFPLVDKIVSFYADGTLRRPMGSLLPAGEPVVTFSGLTDTTTFLRQIREVLSILQDALGVPVDVEFAHDGKDLYILQCRPQTSAGDDRRVPIPTGIPAARKLFSANRYISTAQVSGIRYVVYIDPLDYEQLASRNEMIAVGDAVRRLNGLLPRRSFILMGPGRWGSRGDVTLGVRVTYADISNTLMLVEIARKKGNYVPDLSFGTHFFQDLVEAKIKYLALYPDEEGVIFDEAFFRRSPNALASLIPDCAHLQHVVRVIDIEEVASGYEASVIMDGEEEEALGFLTEKRSPARRQGPAGRVAGRA